MERKNRVPINRLERFFDEQDFQVEMEMARDFVENDMNFRIVVYRVDRDKTDTDDLYGELDYNELHFKTPIEVHAIVELSEPDNKTHDNTGRLRYQEHGMLTAYVYQHELEESNIDIRYGDIIAYAETEDRIRYYTIVDDGKIYFDNSHTHYGYKGFYRTIKSIPIDPNELNLQNETFE